MSKSQKTDKEIVWEKLSTVHIPKHGIITFWPSCKGGVQAADLIFLSGSNNGKTYFDIESTKKHNSDMTEEEELTWDKNTAVKKAAMDAIIHNVMKKIKHETKQIKKEEDKQRIQVTVIK